MVAERVSDLGRRKLNEFTHLLIIGKHDWKLVMLTCRSEKDLTQPITPLPPPASIRISEEKIKIGNVRGKGPTTILSSRHDFP